MTQIDPDYAAEVSGDDAEILTLLRSPEGLCAYAARVSSPNQTNTEYAKLLKHCMTHGHWSVFEQLTLNFEITTSRVIAAQLLRHNSLRFQEFSQRYAKVPESYERFEARRQDSKNRQNSINDMPENDRQWWDTIQERAWEANYHYYKEALNRGIAKEQARAILPLSTTTRLYASGTLRSWIHYVGVRGEAAAQKEHREIAEGIKEILIKKLPIVAAACDWDKEDL